LQLRYYEEIPDPVIVTQEEPDPAPLAPHRYVTDQHLDQCLDRFDLYWTSDGMVFPDLEEIARTAEYLLEVHVPDGHQYDLRDVATVRRRLMHHASIHTPSYEEYTAD
jgi:hypothetical protein